MLRLRLMRRAVPAGAHTGRGATPSRLLASLAALVAAALLIAPSLARADSATSLTVVGTSDLSDSGLVQKVLEPAFAAAYPQYSFKYTGTTPATAFTDAQTGAGGASVLLVHSPSLENDLVSGGYSYEPYGRALWTSDYVVLGPTTDPAGVHTNATNNAPQALADIAAAGIAHTAEFVSRGGTAGTTIEEHQLWALVASSSLEPAGLDLCVVGAADGGGDTPIAASTGVANGAPCPNGGAVPSGKVLPSWYASTGLSQGPNVTAANACTGYASGANSCYVLSDRGTYDYLLSGDDSNGVTPSLIPNLAVLTRDDSATAPGGQYALLSYFHGYIINPAKPGETVNLTAAQAFLNLITSAPVQQAVSSYLSNSGDPGGSPFIADASPLINLKKQLPQKYTASQPITLTGTVTNQQAGFPVPAGIVVTVSRVTGDTSLPVTSVKTSSTGAFTLKFTPAASGSYTLSTPQFSQIEDATLSPPFGDILSPSVTSPSYISVHGAVSDLSASSLGGRALVTGAVSPATGHVNGRVTVYARKLGSKGGYRKLSEARLSSTDGRFAAAVGLAAGRWQLKTFFSDKGTLSTSRGRTTVVTVGAASSARITATGGKVTGSGKLTTHVRISPTAVKGAKVSLVLVKLSAGGKPSRSVGDTVKPKAGAGTVTLHATLKGAGHWAVLESYSVPGKVTAWTRTVGHVTIRKSTKKK